MDLDEFRRLAGAIKQPLLLIASSGEILAANDAARRLSGGLLPGRSLADALVDPSNLHARLRTWLRHGTPVPARFALLTGDGPLTCQASVARLQVADRPAVLIQAHRGEPRSFAALNEHMRRLNDEVAYRRALADQREAALRAEQQARDRFERLQTLSAALAAAATVDQALAAILAHVPAAVGARLAIVRDCSRQHGHDGAAISGVARADAAATVRQPLTDVIADGRPRFFRDPAQQRAQYPHLAPTGQHTGLFLAAALPLAGDREGERAGALGLVCAEEDSFSQDQRVIAGIVASQCGQALTRARLYDHERDFAETLQHALLPSELPAIGGIDLAVRYLPATERIAVGGDWYDAIVFDGSRVGIVVGDIAGHGPSAATAMGQLRNALRALASTIPEPQDTLAALNGYVCRQLPTVMATIVYLVIDRDAGTVCYANAGHPPPMVVTPDETATYLRETLSPPVGVAADTDYRLSTQPISPGSLLVAYTDGLIERRSESLDAGLARLRRGAGDASTDAQGLADHLVTTLVGDAGLDDDATVLTAHLKA